VIDNVERVMIGKRPEVELPLITLLRGGHVLIEDAPGLGKTVLARSIAASLGCHVTHPALEGVGGLSQAARSYAGASIWRAQRARQA
jgi:MoxR-like ATPase